MSEYQIVSWRGIPSMVVARDEEGTARVQLDARFQEAIDEAAMRMGQTSSDAYLEGWSRSTWITAHGSPLASELAGRVGQDLVDEWPDDRIAQHVDSLLG